MRIAFYCPLKPPDHPTPSGDRRMARELMAALQGEGAAVALASRLRTRLGQPDGAAFQALVDAGRAEADRLIAAWTADPAQRPDIWLTYHCYHKAPDLVGPIVARALGLPYALVEASVAGKRAAGPWAAGYTAALDAVGMAGRIFCPNPGDAAGLAPHVAGPGVLVDLPPFLDGAPYRAARADHGANRAAWAARLGLPADDGAVWCLGVGMMRQDDKLTSYRTMADALNTLPKAGWRIILAGDGPTRGAVEAAYAGLPVYLTGQLGGDELAGLYGAADLFLWPAINEAFGYALLEAQAAGLPAVIGEGPGTANILRQGETGLLVPVRDTAAFAGAVDALLGDPARRAAMGKAASTNIQARHDRKAAGAVLLRELAELAA